MSSRRQLVLWSSRIAALVMVVVAVGWLRPTAQGDGLDDPGLERAETRPMPRIGVAEVVTRDLVVTAEAMGHLQARRQVELDFEVEGRVVDLRVEEGSWVEAGEVLAELDARRFRIAVEEAEAELLTVQARYAVFTGIDSTGIGSADGVEGGEARVAPPDRATIEHQRDEGLISEAEFLRARRASEVDHLLRGSRQEEVRAAITGLVQAELSLKRARLDLAATVLKAPFSGRIADVAIDVGTRVPIDEPVLTLMDTRRMQVEVEVLEADLVRATRGDRVAVRLPAHADREVAGVVSSINPRIDHELGSGRLTIEITDPDADLLPGQLAWVELELEHLAARLAVPEAAILERKGRSVVFRVANGRVEWINVETGARVGDWIELVTGVEAGDQVAVSGHLSLGHGAEVEVFDASFDATDGGLR
ncbi:MAG: efflux RND transporter periplasmic adaptor subunit [Acidobacteriota bacterium]